MSQKESNIKKLQATLERPKEVEKAVEQATAYVAEQMETILILDKIQVLLGEINSVGDGIDEGDIFELLDIKTKQNEFLKEIDYLLKGLKGGIDRNSINATVREMIFKQKRLMLQRFLDFDKDKGIRFRRLDDIGVYFSIQPS